VADTKTTDSFSKRKQATRQRILEITKTDSLPDFMVAIIDQQLRTGIRTVPADEIHSIYCSAEWHLARFQGEGTKYAPLIYNLAFRLADKSGRFWPSVPQLARYFNAPEKYIREAIHLLLESGFFVVLSAEKGKSVAYRPVPHSEWAEAHPGFCIHKDKLPFGDGDELGCSLFAIADGRYRPFPQFLTAMRKTGHSDDAIVEHWRVFLSTYTGPRWKGISKHFLDYLRGQTVMTPTL
jgi:hypothetical protein